MTKAKLFLIIVVSCLLFAVVGDAEQLDLSVFQGVYRQSEIYVGPDLGEEREEEGYVNYQALNMRGSIPPANLAWFTKYPVSYYGDGVYRTVILENEINGIQWGGVVASFLPGHNALVGGMGEGKGTDYVSIGVLHPNGTITWLVNQSYGDYIPTYGGHSCDHNRSQYDWHMHCQWIVVEMILETTDATFDSIEVTVNVYLVGSGLLGDLTRDNPESSYTLAASVSWSGIRPADVAPNGYAGLFSWVQQGVMENSFYKMEILPVTQLPPIPEECLPYLE